MVKEIQMLKEKQQAQEQPVAKVKEYELMQFPTQHGIAILTPNEELLGKDYGVMEVLNEILNKLNKMEKALLG